MPRFSLKTLLIAAAVVPVAAYALVKAGPIVASVVMTIAFFGWIASVVVWLGSDGELREIARAFVVSTLTYGIMAFGVVPPTSLSEWHLGTTHLLILLHEAVAVPTALPPPFLVTDSPGVTTFIVVGEVYWCVIVGLCSGWFAGWLYRRRQKANQAGTEASSNP